MQCEKSHRTASDRSKWSFFGPFFQRLGCFRSRFWFFSRLGCRRLLNRQIGSRFVLFARHIRRWGRGHHFCAGTIFEVKATDRRVRPEGWALLELFPPLNWEFDWFEPEEIVCWLVLNFHPGSKIYPVGDGKSVMRCVRRVAQWVLTIMIGDDILS